jgi:DNA-damage-inducible protein J
VNTHLKKDTEIRARINSSVKEEATAVLKAIGLTPSGAYQLMMLKIATEKALPFDPLVPNAETIEAIKAARRGELIAVASSSQLFDDLDEEDD